MHIVGPHQSVTTDKGTFGPGEEVEVDSKEAKELLDKGVLIDSKDAKALIDKGELPDPKNPGGGPQLAEGTPEGHYERREPQHETTGKERETVTQPQSPHEAASRETREAANRAEHDTPKRR